MTIDTTVPIRRKRISHDPDFPFAVVSNLNEHLLARFADEAEAIEYAVDRAARVTNTAPPPPPAAPGWYESMQFPINTPLAEYNPFFLDELGVWYEVQSDRRRELTYDEVRSFMPLLSIGRPRP